MNTWPQASAANEADVIAGVARRLDVEASLVAASATSNTHLEEMGKCLENAYVKIEALQQQSRLLNEEANNLSEENDRLASTIADRDETIRMMREQVQELGQTIVRLEKERQNSEFTAHMLSVEQAMHTRSHQRLKRSMSVSVPGADRHQREWPAAALDAGQPADIAAMQEQRNQILQLQAGGMVGLETALATIEARIEALSCEQNGKYSHGPRQSG